MVVMDKVETGNNIKRLMRLAHVSIFDLQMALRLQSATSIYAWCRGEYVPSTEYLVKLSKILNCKMDDIIVTKEADTDDAL